MLSEFRRKFSIPADLPAFAFPKELTVKSLKKRKALIMLDFPEAFAPKTAALQSNPIPVSPTVITGLFATFGSLSDVATMDRHAGSLKDRTFPKEN